MGVHSPLMHESNLRRALVSAYDKTAATRACILQLWGAVSEKRNLGDTMATIIGDNGDNDLVGTDGNDTIDGEGGDDTIDGGDGDDLLYGGSGNDTIFGGRGSDFIVGGLGSDILTGGPGSDTYSYGADGYIGIFSDTITDLSTDDRISIRNSEPDGITVNRVSEFSGTAGEYMFSTGAGQSYISIDMDGDGTADETLTISNGEFNFVAVGFVTGPDGFLGFTFRIQPETVGSEADDLLYGGPDNERIEGFGGDDVISDGGGNDFVIAGAGNDTITLQRGDDRYFGQEGDDTFIFTDDMGISNLILGGEGFDTIDLRGITIPTGWDFSTADTIERYLGGDIGVRIELADTDLTQTIFDMGSGDDTIRGGGLDDTINTGAGDDLITVSQGSDVIDGGEGSDRINFFNIGATQGVIADLRTGVISNNGFGQTQTFTGIESLGFGTRFADVFHGDDNDNTLVGTGSGNTINGYGGDDFIQIDAAGTIDGGGGIDRLVITDGTFAPDLDTNGNFVIIPASQGIEFDLSLGTLDNDGHGNSGTAMNFENATIVTNFNSTLIGTNDANDLSTIGTGNNLINGLGGADTLVGGDGFDSIFGGDQNDTLFGGGGNDRLFGQRGADFLYGGDGNDLVLGGNRNDRLFGEAGDDRVFGGNDQDEVDGGSGNDILRGGNGDDFLIGDLGNDVLFGGTGRDELFGTEGDDALFGRGGFDILNGGSGNDIMEGGLQADQFIIQSMDTDVITDFAATNNAERIHFTDLFEITDFDDLMNNHINQVGSDVVINDGIGGTLTLLNVNLADLDAADFVF